MTLIRWQPLQEVTLLDRHMQSHFDRLLDVTFGDTSVGRLTAPMDVTRSGDDLLIRIEVPGIDAEKDLDISLEDHVLYVSGERRSTSESSDETVFFRETTRGSFCRSIPLSGHVQPDDVSADYTEGILEIRVKGGAVSIGEGPHRIAVRAAGAPELESAGESVSGAAAEAPAAEAAAARARKE